MDPEPPAARRPRPLDGIRVLDLTRVLSGPHCTRMLCDLGADVIKVEPPDGDMTRFSNPRVNSLASYFIQQNTGKRNVSLDMSKAEGKDLLLRLAEHCDVLVENFRPGVMERIGLGYAAVSARHPRIVYASISGYGQTGPWVHRRAYAPVVGAETGITKAQGDARAKVTGITNYANDPHSHADVYTSLECASGILAALYQRERTGRGDWVDISMAQTMLYVNEHVHDHLWDGPVEPDWIRSFQPGDYPVLTVANGETVVVSGHPAERGTFDRYIGAMGRSELAADPRFSDVPARLANYPALIELMQQWAGTVADPVTFEEALAAHGLASGTLRTVREICDTEWAEARGAVVSVSDRGGGRVRIPNAPWRFAGADVGMHGEPRYRGEDNHDVLRELLGLDEEQLARLDAAGVLSHRVPPLA
jgi:crotonobetainyl-CoA:carnitine CoA-transferase CaiB-like acyl-CoA transferase